MPDYGYAEHLIWQLGLHKRLPFLGKIWESLPTSPDITHRVGWISGCCMLIPRDKYLEVGGLNETLVFYGEEPEFGHRTRKLGYKTIYYSDAEIIHLRGVSTNKQNKEENRKEKIPDALAQDLKQYDALIELTNGYKKAINVTRLTILASRFKVLIGYSPEMFKAKSS